MPPSFPLLPQRIAGLAGIACNLNWSWNRDARALFRALDENLWIKNRFDPLGLLHEMGAERLAHHAADPHFLARYDAVMRWAESEKSSDFTWFASTFPSLRSRTVAYFCAEFGVYHSVPIYSGGLGVLAGDHCKTASDLGVPLVGVGLMYRGGYFDQRIRPDGWQEEVDDHFDPRQTPLEQLAGPGGRDYLAAVRTGSRDVHIRVWRLGVGRVPVYLLDADLEENHPDDRGLLSRLYAGGPELRLRQEWLLGVGGVRVLRALGLEPAAWHCNEGHAAFMLIERLRELVARGVRFDDAVLQVRASSAFTTHTPVPAGHDVFSADQIEACTGAVWQEMGISREAFVGLGRHPEADGGTFHMTAAAIRLSRRVNGVSRTHGVVTRRIWTSLWPERPAAEIPIRHVTNGVHLASWMARPMMKVLDGHFGRGWDQRVDDAAFWDDVLQLSDTEVWAAHQELKHTLLTLVREEARHAFAQRSREAIQLVGSGVLLSPDTLTIGFGRRFATYKRASLLFHDVERLLRILTHPSHPVQLVFAGKAHPADTPGKRVLQEVYQTTRDPRFEGRIAFVVDYDLRLAHVLVHGVDLWLNVPRVPMEACGTSGMKAALNGVPQLSTPDGWWAEGFDGHNGWTIPASESDAVHDSDDGAAAANATYELLEREVVPTFYARDARGLPHRWIVMMKHAIRTAGSHFTAHRMLMEYVRDYYVPAIVGDSGPDVPPPP